MRHAFSWDLRILLWHMTVFRARGLGFWTSPGWDGKFEPELSSLSSGTKVSYFFIQRCFEVQISLSRADGSEKEISKKVPVLPSKKNSIDDKIQHLGGAIEQNNLQKLKFLGSCLRGMLKLRIDRRISCIVPFHFVQPMSPQCPASESLC